MKITASIIAAARIAFAIFLPSINCLYKAGFDVIPIGSRIDYRFIG